MFRINISPPSSGLKKAITAGAVSSLFVCCFLLLLVGTENRGDMFLRNVGLSLNYMTLHLRRQACHSEAVWFVTVRPSVGVLPCPRERHDLLVAGSQETRREGKLIDCSMMLYQLLVLHIDACSRVIMNKKRSHIIARTTKKISQEGWKLLPKFSECKNAVACKISPRTMMLLACLRWQYRGGLGGVFRPIRPV